MAITSNLDLVRLRIGDTDENDPLLYDDEITAFIGAHSTVTTDGTLVAIGSAAADAAQAIAAKFARGYNFSTDGQSFNRSERVNHYLGLAAQLRRQSGGQSVPVLSSVATAMDAGLTLGE